jgi:glycosyltransferase involved in cell wall biosynthesis
MNQDRWKRSGMTRLDEMPQKIPEQKRIAFFITTHWNQTEGCVRPFVNWAKEITADGGEVDFITHKCGRKLVDFFSGFPGGPGRTRVFESGSDDEMRRALASSVPSTLVLEDSPPSLRAIRGLEAKHVKTRLCVYAQILFGSHSIAEVFKIDGLMLKQRLQFEASKAVPFSLLKQGYMKTLGQHVDIIIANSQTTASHLQTLYGIEPHGIVYPPVDRSVFKRSTGAKKKQALLYLGSNGGDTDPALIRRILKELDGTGMEAVVFGNQTLRKRLEAEGTALRTIGGPEDDALARAYSESLLTICPQKWETFGYVAAESISCGTPPLVFNCMGNAEIVRMSSCGILANRTDEFLDAVRNMKGTGMEAAYPESLAFDKKASTGSLLALLGKKQQNAGVD